MKNLVDFDDVCQNMNILKLLRTVLFKVSTSIVSIFELVFFW